MKAVNRNNHSYKTVVINRNQLKCVFRNYGSWVDGNSRKDGFQRTVVISGFEFPLHFSVMNLWVVVTHKIWS